MSKDTKSFQPKTLFQVVTHNIDYDYDVEWDLKLSKNSRVSYTMKIHLFLIFFNLLNRTVIVHTQVL